MRRRQESGEARELFYRVLALLYSHSREAVVVEWPKSVEKRSVDMVVRLKDGRIVLVKATHDAARLPKREVQELRGLAAALGASPLIVASRLHGEELLSYVVYERQGVKVVNYETLEEAVAGRGEIYVYGSRDHLRVSIDPEALRRRRLEKRLSLGDVAAALGVSRKTVYEYERGSMEPTLEKAEKLVDMLGPEVLKPIDIFEEPSEPPEVGAVQAGPGADLASRIASMLLRAGFRVAQARRTSVDVAAGSERERMLFVVKHRRESIATFVERHEASEKISRVVEGEYYVVAEPEEARRLKGELEVVTPEEVSGIVSGAGEVRRGAGEAGDNRKAGGR